jgi:hypothetical protein
MGLFDRLFGGAGAPKDGSTPLPANAVMFANDVRLTTQVLPSVPATATMEAWVSVAARQAQDAVVAQWSDLQIPAALVKELREKDGEVKITLSLKALSADPWSALAVLAPVGKVLAGSVSRIADFGAFVRIAAGINAIGRNTQGVRLVDLRDGDYLAGLDVVSEADLDRYVAERAAAGPMEALPDLSDEAGDDEGDDLTEDQVDDGADDGADDAEGDE